MKAVVLEKINAPLAFKDFEMPLLNDNEVLIKVNAAALNHRDVFIQQGLYAGIVTPIILGADGCGVVVQEHNTSVASLLNQEVIINPSLNWGNNPRVQSKDYVILGTPNHGTFAQYVKANARLVQPKPAHLTAQQAAALPLAGLTAYRAVFTRGEVSKNKNVLITGIGGGVALFAMQFAIAAGANVYVNSSSDDKIKKAIAMGAKGGINYTLNDWHKTLNKEVGGFDVIIDGAGGDAFAKYVDMAKPAANIVMYGATAGAFNSGVPAKIFWKQLNIMGSTMGNDKEFEAMIEFVNTHKIVPEISNEFNLSDAQQALDLMNKGKQFGKIILNIPH